MAWDFRPGMRVVCVDADPLPDTDWYCGEEPQVGAIYTLDHVFTDTDGELVVLLKELHRSLEAMLEWGADIAYLACRFRPLDETRLDVFRALLNPAPKRVQEPA
ncbi:MAG: hypothetical protein DI629_12275 [Mesorhizobium amorphae]|nr:MAG: hypothetical protein DI629_12275 [Mesorhizobium amorphae]